MKKFTKTIDKQIAHNKGKNLFHNDTDLLHFIYDTVQTITEIDDLDSESKEFLIGYVTDKALEEFSRINQYYSFNSQAKKDLKKIYSVLLSEIQDKQYTIEKLSENHYQRLKDWLVTYNAFAEILYANEQETIKPVPCSEYDPELQIKILRIDMENLMQPILDIGCGKEGKLVSYIAKKGLEVYGIDRLAEPGRNLQKCDWHEFDYGTQKWGTIISNLGFSNHFIHHNLRKDGDYIQYAKTYMNILHALKKGGRFFYAPDLPFIEQYLDSNEFVVHRYKIQNYDGRTSQIVRLS